MAIRNCILGALCTALLSSCDNPDAPSSNSCPQARQAVAGLTPRTINYGFYTDFNPLSYAATRQASAPGFNQPLGYEPALIAAVEAFSRGRLTFNPQGIGNPFSGIWLKAQEAPYDLVGGGITRLPQRTRDGSGRQLIRFGVGHVGFRQSLLVRSTSTIVRHEDLTSEHLVGALRDTTGEARLLALLGVTDARGWLRAGTRILLADGTVLTAAAPGSDGALRIAAGEPSQAIANRIRLLPAGDDRPRVRYLDSEAEQILALLEGRVDAVARGEIGNLVAAREAPGLRVTAIDPTATEWAGFSYANTHAGNALRATLDTVIRCLTDEGAIGFSQWLDSGGTVFYERALSQGIRESIHKSIRDDQNPWQRRRSATLTVPHPQAHALSTTPSAPHPSGPRPQPRTLRPAGCSPTPLRRSCN